jgi:hypothetical protein
MMNGFNRAQAEYDARLPASPPMITGSIRGYLVAGPHAEKLALLEFAENNLIGASDMETGDEIRIEEIHETDINRGLEALIEIKAYHGK